MTGADQYSPPLTLKSLLLHSSGYSTFPISPSLCILPPFKKRRYLCINPRKISTNALSKTSDSYKFISTYKRSPTISLTRIFSLRFKKYIGIYLKIVLLNIGITDNSMYSYISTSTYHDLWHKTWVILLAEFI